MLNFEDLKTQLVKNYSVSDLSVYYIVNGRRLRVFGDEFSEETLEKFQCLTHTVVNENALGLYADKLYKSQLVLKLQGYEQNGVRRIVNRDKSGLGKSVNFEFMVVVSSNALETFKTPQNIILAILEYFTKGE